MSGFDGSSYLGLVIILLHNLKDASITHLIVVLIFIILIALVIFILVILILEIVLVEVIKAVLELQRFASEPIDGAWDELLFDVLAELVVEFELGSRSPRRSLPPHRQAARRD